MPDLSLHQLLLRFVALLFVVSIHGWAVAAAADVLGDPGPRYDKRKTPNPFAHLDPLGSLGLLLFGLGWIRPMDVRPGELREPRRGPVLLVLGSLAAVVLAVVLLQLLRPVIFAALPSAAGPTVLSLVAITVRFGLWFVLLNLVPIPPLTGGYLLMALLPARWPAIRRYQAYLGVLLAVGIFFGVVQVLLSPGYDLLARILAA